MRDYLTTYLRNMPEPSKASATGVVPEYATPELLPKLTEPNRGGCGRGSVSFGSALTLTRPENESAQPAANEQRLEGRARRAWLLRLGVRRLPLWTVCRQVSHTLADADLLFAALALADGLPAEHLLEELRRVSQCGAKAPAVVGEAVQRGKEILTPEQVAAYVAAHPFAWELGLSLGDYKQERPINASEERGKV